MARQAGICLSSLLFILLIMAGAPQAQKGAPSVANFKVEALYRAAKLSWKGKAGPGQELAVKILRADTFADGPYREVGVVKLIPSKTSYEYIDKSMGAEAKYYYKLTVPETGESCGPLSTRPYFSPPAT